MTKEKTNLKWGEISAISKLTKKREEFIIKNLNLSAKTHNAFNVVLTPAEYDFVKTNINCCIQRITSAPGESSCYVIGRDTLSLNMYIKRM